MDDYSVFIYSAYGVTAVVMLYLAVTTITRWVKSKKALKELNSDDGL